MIGQDHIVTTLKNQITNNRIAHAYLFTGTRGTGKTSTAKIFSKAVNCLNPVDSSPCNACPICEGANAGTLLDIVEMDAASNRKLENALDIIETVKYPPTTAKYKVYIIDEVHMLTTQAFNALLKTIEEPPEHVIFILATTDPQKVPATILSRCQRFDFKRIKTDDAFSRLRHIIDMKGVYADDNALKAIAKVSEGAMRDCLSILDQAISMGDGRVDMDLVSSMLGITGADSIIRLVDSMADGNIEASLSEIDSVIMSGRDISQFVKDVIKHLRNLLVVRISKNPSETIDLGEDSLNKLLEQSRKLQYEDIVRGINLFLEAEQEMKQSSQWKIVLEMCIIRFSKREYDHSTETLLKRIARLEGIIESGNIKVAAAPSEAAAPRQSTATPAPKQEQRVTSKDTVSAPPVEEEVLSGDRITLNQQQVQGALVEVLNALRANKKMTVYAHLVNGTINKVDGNTIYIGFTEDFKFSKTMLEKPEYTKGLQAYFEKFLHGKVFVRFLLEKGPEDDFNSSINNAKAILGEDFIEVIE